MGRGLRLLIVALFGLVVAGGGLAAQTTERIDRVIPFGDGGRVELRTFSGHVRITGTDRDEVVIRAVRRAPHDLLSRVKLEIRESRAVIEIVANQLRRTWRDWFRSDKGDVVETDFEIEVPRDTDLAVRVFSSPVAIERVRGDHDVGTFSGNVEIRLSDSAAADVEFRSESGRLSSDEPLIFRHRNRRRLAAVLNDTGRTQHRRKLRFKTFSGDVTLRR
ncbi:MAG: DUF4097 family beta strand repeat-containing protein [Vicinamibacterales bacterium]|jgi:hypothetical protein|nr:DUF4097 family beta strand repeat-containing protein [Vicinamibacterales bacterium]|tara:strand:+ start:7115 stop:7771 length:657 start_codon:yes stop_codon:yes gene_type:complete